MNTSRALMALLLLPALAGAAEQGRIVVNLSGSGWKLWHDAKAEYKNDTIYAPPVNLAGLLTNPPTGGWSALDKVKATPCSVPGTVEEYLGNGKGPADPALSKLQGVSWWWRDITLPPVKNGRRALLKFEAVRQRAEVFIDGKLVGYDVVGMAPFDVDITKAAANGGKHRLAVRITNPGGRYDWIDFLAFNWGKSRVPLGRAFGGFAGGLTLVVLEPVAIDNLWVENTPEARKVALHVDVVNTTDKPVKRSVFFVIREKKTGKVVHKSSAQGELCTPGLSSRFTVSTVPNAKLWSVEKPNLYTLEATLTGGAKTDSDKRTFGFRSFVVDGVGNDAMFRLNGKRIVLRTAISWGFWPITGLYPTDEQAERQVRAAKNFGMNMLNFHRSPGHTNVLDKADELGLLYFQEPGGYVSVGNDPVGLALARERFLRLVKRDRSHPSLIIHNMINEQWDAQGAKQDPSLYAKHRADLLAAHAIDPSRIITYASAWSAERQAKMHMLPYSNEVRFFGWDDSHNAGGPVTWRQEFYQDPLHYYNRTENKGEIVYWGEEGAISTPPRLDLIVKELSKAPRPGWDGNVYRSWQKQFDSFLTRKHLRDAFPTVDSLCLSMGNVAVAHQGQKIELMRLNNISDGYAINGWEAEVIENHSGIVDCFRNPKGDPKLLSRYNQPVYVAVMPRKRVVGVPGSVIVDFFVINEKNLKGPMKLIVSAWDENKKLFWSVGKDVNVKGGDTYGQLLAEGIEIPIKKQVGKITVQGILVEVGVTMSSTIKSGGKKQTVTAADFDVIHASGDKDLYAVDWRTPKPAGKGAVLEMGDAIRRFLKTDKGLDVPALSPNLGKLDWVIVASPQSSDEPVPSSVFQTPDGKPGLLATFFKGKDFKTQIHQRIDPTVALDTAPNAAPDPAVPDASNYCVRWEGVLNPPVTGRYRFTARTDDGVRLWVDGKLLASMWEDGPPRDASGSVELVAGKPVTIRYDFYQAAGGAFANLTWSRPNATTPVTDLARRCKQDGTTLIVLEGADQWLGALPLDPGVKLGSKFTVGDLWVGGHYFVRKHPLFTGLPTNLTLDWQYQQVVPQPGPNRIGLNIEGEELVVGAYNTWPFHLGTSVGVAKAGKGRVLFSTLRIADQLSGDDSVSGVAKRLLLNFINYAAKK